MKQLTADDVARICQMECLTRLPSAIPSDRILVHNTVRPSRRLGANGARAWLSPQDHAPRYVRCDCGWARELGEHFVSRVRTDPGA